jgi:hypothetical protein
MRRGRIDHVDGTQMRLILLADALEHALGAGRSTRTAMIFRLERLGDALGHRQIVEVW